MSTIAVGDEIRFKKNSGMFDDFRKGQRGTVSRVLAPGIYMITTDADIEVIGLAEHVERVDQLTLF